MSHGIIRGIKHNIVHGVRHGGTSPIGGNATLFVLMIGDSNCVGQGVGDAADTGFAVGTPNTGVLFNAHYAIGVGPPPTFVDFPANQTMGNLGLYAASGAASFGTELTTGTVLQAFSARPAIAKVAISGSTLATEWLPTSTYPAAGAGNLYNLTVARVHQLEAILGKSLDGIIVHLGTNDALNGTNAGNFGANMLALANALRTDFNANLPITWVRTNAATTNPFTATVQSAQDTFALSGDPITNTVVVDNDDLPLLGDGLHYTTSAYINLGQRLGFALSGQLGFAGTTVTGAPQVLGWGSGISGTGNLSVPSWGGAKSGDLEYLAVATGIVAGTIPTPAGWTAVASTASTASGVTEQYAVFSRQVTGAMLSANHNHTAPTTVAPTTTARHAAKIFTIRGPSANPLTDVTATTAPNTFDTGPTSMSAVTTTAANDIVLFFTGGFCASDPTMSATNGTLTGFTKIQDSEFNILTDREVITLFAGTKATAGSSGTASVSSTANMVKLGVTVAVKP